MFAQRKKLTQRKFLTLGAKMKKQLYSENQQTVSQWSRGTFGAVPSNLSVAVRASDEMWELLTCLSVSDRNEKAGSEMADVVIVLYRLASEMGIDLQTEIDKKMKINRNRQWNKEKWEHL